MQSFSLQFAMFNIKNFQI